MDNDEKEMKELMKTSGFGWRVSASIALGIGWLVFLIIWLFFCAGSFTIFQNIAIFLASVLVVVGLMASTWVSWGMRYGMKYGRMNHEYCEECCPHMPGRIRRKARRTGNRRR